VSEDTEFAGGRRGLWHRRSIFTEDCKAAAGLVGKVYCKVDASYSPTRIGDFLTTSFTPGHAMKASDLLRASGAVIGKALRPLTDGQGLIPILIALQ